MELCLGTVQFGMDYGVFNQRMPKRDDAIKCLEYAVDHGIKAIDTATAYGEAEQVVGEFLAKHENIKKDLFISTKMLPNILDDYSSKDYKTVIKQNLLNSLNRMHRDYIDAYLLHSARYAFRDDILSALYEMKKDCLAKKVGVSVYEPEEAIACFKSGFVDFIQLPYSILDHRMKEAGVFDSPLKGNCEIHSRTAFVKGLVKLDINEIPSYLASAKPIIERFDRICRETGYSRIELAINYVKREKSISHLVIGVRSISQLSEDINIFNREIPQSVLNKIDEEFSGIDANIVVPSLWKK